MALCTVPVAEGDMYYGLAEKELKGDQALGIAACDEAQLAILVQALRVHGPEDIMELLPRGGAERLADVYRLRQAADALRISSVRNGNASAQLRKIIRAVKQGVSE